MRAVALAAALLFTALPARADVTHVVAKGHTIESIAHRYHVTVKAILTANHLTDAKHLHPGQTLIIPGVDKKKKKDKDGDKDGKPSKPEEAGHHHEEHEKLDLEAKDGRDVRDKGSRHGAVAAFLPPPEPRGRGEGDAIHAVRLGEEFRVHVRDPHGHIPPSALKAFERMMRQGNATHTVDPRLVALVSIVSAHFGGKPIEVVSGYRAYTPTQYTPHSNHNLGKALDFRIRGIKNEALRDFCRTLRSAGCGYYPNSTFVHLDVRDTKAYWVDWSHPGEPPKYDKAGVEADEGTSDVPDDNPQPAPMTDPARSDEPAATDPKQP